MKEGMQLIAETEVPGYSFRAYLQKNGQIELWEKDNKANYGFWQLNRRLDFDHAKAYATLLTEVMTKVK